MLKWENDPWMSSSVHKTTNKGVPDIKAKVKVDPVMAPKLRK